MKKCILSILISFLCIPVMVNAAPSGSATCSSSGKVSLNNTITVTVKGTSSEAMWHTTLSYDSSKLQYISGNGLQHISDDFVTGITYTYTFKAVAEGTAYVKTSSSISDYDGEKAFPTSSCSINIVKASVNSEVKKSSDNSLSKLEIDNVEISPKFSKEIYEYTAVVENEIDKINIITKTNHSKASVSGNGERELIEGENKFELVVKAENGATRTYTINVTRKEKDPILVKVDGKEYNLLRNLKDIEIPEMFEETIIKIGEEEVPAFTYKSLNYTLVVLRDSENNINFYNYKDGTYTIFNQVISDNINFVLLEMEKVPTNYKKVTIKVNGNNIDGYKVSGDSKILLYGLNMLTGKKNYYTYDRSEKTLQLFDVDLYEKGVQSNKNNMYYIYGLTLGLVFLFILNMLLLSKNKKQKKLIELVKEKVSVPEENKEEKKSNKKQKEVLDNIEEQVEIETEEETTEDNDTDDFWDEPKRKRKKK